MPTANHPSHPVVSGEVTWFDGRSTARQTAQLDAWPSGMVLRQEADGAGLRRFAWSELDISEPMATAPLSLGLPDGGTLWIQQPDLARSVYRIAQQSVRFRPWGWQGASTLIGSWPAVGLCLVLTLSLLAWFDRQGAAWLGQAVVAQLPRSADQWLGRQIEPRITERWLAPSLGDPARQQALRARFLALAARAAPGVAVELRFLRQKSESRLKPTAREGGFNAMALPNGLIVVLDGLAHALTDDELMWVLGHELGHVVHRHSMQNVARSLGLLAVANAALGDFSTVAATAVAGTQGLAHSRDAEREADAFAHRWAALARLPAHTGSQVWRKFMAHERGRGMSDWPAWTHTHPPLAERLQAAQQGAEAAPSTNGLSLRQAMP